jgi:hypothetical protein
MVLLQVSFVVFLPFIGSSPILVTLNGMANRRQRYILPPLSRDLGLHFINQL